MTSWGVYLQEFSQGATLRNYIAKQMEGIWKDVMAHKKGTSHETSMWFKKTQSH